MAKSSTQDHQLPGGEVPLTSGTVIKWGGFVLALVTAIVTLVWSAARINARLDTLDVRVADVDKKVIEVNQFSIQRHDASQKDIDRLQNHAEQTDKSIVDLSRKLDVAVAILERIDKKVGAN